MERAARQRASTEAAPEIGSDPGTATVSGRTRRSVTDRLLRLVGAGVADGAGVDGQLSALERQADGEEPGFEAFFHNRAGDLCVREGQEARSLGYYGRAIDAYLRAGRFDSAAAVCQKLLRMRPEGVRARCTLAWISLGRGFAQDAASHVQAYVDAAASACKEQLARRHLRRMLTIVDDPELAYQIGEDLIRLGGEGEAEAAFARSVSLGHGTAVVIDERDRWEVVVHASLLGPRASD